MYVKDKKLTVGELQVEVVDCSRLANVDCAAKLYCTVAVGRYTFTYVCTHMYFKFAVQAIIMTDVYSMSSNCCGV